MNRFENPSMNVVLFKTSDTITTSLGTLGDYFAGKDENNTYINEDDYEMSQNPWG